MSNPPPFSVSDITNMKKSDTITLRVKKQTVSAGEKPPQKPFPTSRRQRSNGSFWQFRPKTFGIGCSST